MKLVLLFFCVILTIVLSLVIIILLSSIKLNIKKCNIYNLKGNVKTTKVNTEFLVYIEIYLFGILKIAKVRITKKILDKLKVKNDLKSIENDIKIVNSVNPIEMLKKIKPKIEKLNLHLQIGTESFMLTIYLVAIISAILGFILNNTNPRKTQFVVIPLYNFGNSIKFNLNCIIKVKIVHIIYVIYILFKRRRKQNERTSNRRSYDYSYE